MISWAWTSEGKCNDEKKTFICSILGSCSRLFVVLWDLTNCALVPSGIAELKAVVMGGLCTACNERDV